MRYFILFLGLICLSFQKTYSQDSGDFLKQIDSLRKSPESFNRNKNLGILYKKTGNYKKAIYYLSKANNEKKDIEIEKQLASLWISKGYPEKAIEKLEKVIKKDSSDLYSKFLLAKLYSSLHYNDKGIEILNQLEQKDSTNAWYTYQKAKLLNKDINNKLDTYLAAYRKDTTWLKPIYAIAQIYNKIKFYDSSFFFIEKGLKLRPAHSGLISMKVQELYRQKKYHKMKHTLKQMDSMHIKPFYTHKMLGIAYYFLKEKDSAIKHLNIALKISAKDPDLFLYKSYVLYAQKKITEAREAALQSLRYRRVPVDLEYYQLGIIARERKQYKKAINYFYKSYEEKKTNTNALFEWARTSDLYYKDKKLILNRYQKFLKTTLPKNFSYELFAKNRVYELKTELFMKN